MSGIRRRGLAACIVAVAVQAACAQEAAPPARAAAGAPLPPGLTEAMLAPPPMPGFMRDGSAARLGLDRMAREAAAEAARVRSAGRAPSAAASTAATATAPGTSAKPIAAAAAHPVPR